MTNIKVEITGIDEVTVTKKTSETSSSFFTLTKEQALQVQSDLFDLIMKFELGES